MGAIQSSINSMIGSAAKVAGTAKAISKINTDLQKAKLARNTLSGKKQAIKQNRQAATNRLLAIQGFKMKEGEK